MLAEMLDALADRVVHGDTTTEIGDVAYDSRSVQAGSLFCCLSGAVADGHDFAPRAVHGGAVALLSQRRLDLGVPEVVVADTRDAMGRLAACLHGDPSNALAVVGITGTNGKTTTAHLIEQLLATLGRQAAVIGTLTGARTTPESPDLQARLAELRDEGVDTVAMEVSSHALSLSRVAGTRFRVAVFTNLTPEHLDFHADMEDYYRAKARLFSPDLSDVGLICGDDSYGRRLLSETSLDTVEYRLDQLADLEVGLDSSSFSWRGRRVVVPMGGAFNVRNVLAAAEALLLLGHDPDEIARGLGHTSAVPGRFELVDRGQDFTVVVDYAHTPDGLSHVLSTARELVGSGRVLVVFGSGGDRDRAKRPLMGEAVARSSDLAWLTSDNPRGEDPDRIIAEVLSGVGDLGRVETESDRRAAIAAAIATASAGDIIVIAGKGHETTQIVGSEERPFDDRVVVAELLATRSADR